MSSDKKISEFEQLMAEVRAQRPPLPQEVRKLLEHYKAAEIIETVLLMTESEASTAEQRHLRAQQELNAARNAAAKAGGTNAS